MPCASERCSRASSDGRIGPIISWGTLVKTQFSVTSFNREEGRPAVSISRSPLVGAGGCEQVLTKEN